ncbi:DNA mismatch repair protein [Haloferax volcanii]|uniref:DNA mismatch repair protein MutS n=3 Tax=Haloferax volcanii TaxID=2246 RepID=D4GXN9_HALVD|nr:DNA mismatch repair protein [Haloferax volcanii]ADE03793.1 DNA mismatch repair protein MutS [Haloferax volcanii DS2]ELY27960.1 DNA mismatch repair protein MutS [Haloferax volcanii DS2]MBS8117792.1 DNA mismatch repair protein [Haloferax volcanii]MBS8122804.1 DNA mismatch repair protein [Haloferax volcanii]MBS8126672.1 DNA mismatch repair protein [Haloferax volcanii]
MRLEDYWGVGPKTSDRLESALGREGAVAAIESADVRALVDAGVTRGRAVRILRRADGQAGIDALATRDARNVYDDLLSLASDRGLTEHAADRIRVLTPLPTVEARRDRLDRILAAREAWADLDDDARDAIEATFREYDVAGETERAAVRAALELREAGLRGEPFDALAEADPDALRDALGALGYVDNDGSVAAGADDRLDSLRSRLDTAKELQSGSFDVLETVQSRGVRSLDDFRAAFVQYVAQETDLSRGEIEAVAAEDARDATDFVSASLRALVEDLEADVAAREETVAEELRDRIWAARDDVDLAVEAVDEVALSLSLARFADEYDLTPPDIAETGLAVCGARNLFIDDPQPVSYAVGDHELACASGPTPPVGDRVSVLTGANSGGKTTLLETLSQVAILASMGLPVPAESAVVGRFDSVVFHRRHASFNAGVLESTIKSIVPPLSGDGRTLMLVDEFEAITEPGRAADLLNGLVNLTVERDAFGVYVTHLADELSPLPPEARIDGIFAEGLTDELELRVDYQPRFGTVGKSTPEFIVSRLVANARDRAERAGFEALAAAVGEEAVQKTLSDAEFVD